MFHSVASRVPSEEFLEQPAQPTGHAPERAGTDQPAGFADVIALRVQHQPDRRRELGTVHVIGKPADAGRRSAPDGQIEDLLRDLRHALENRAAARQHDARS